MVKEKGFTRDIAEYLELDYPEKDRGKLIVLGKAIMRRMHFFTDSAISAKQFIKCCEMIPEWNINSNNIGEPFSLKKYLKLAKRYPDLLFEGYIITENRPDERLDIDGIFIPREKGRYRRLLKRLIRKKPDENNHHIYYTRLWWD